MNVYITIGKMKCPQQLTPLVFMCFLCRQCCKGIFFLQHHHQSIIEKYLKGNYSIPIEYTINAQYVGPGSFEIITFSKALLKMNQSSCCFQHYGHSLYMSFKSLFKSKSYLMSKEINNATFIKSRSGNDNRPAPEKLLSLLTWIGEQSIDSKPNLKKQTTLRIGPEVVVLGQPRHVRTDGCRCRQREKEGYSATTRHSICWGHRLGFHFGWR